MQLLNKLWEKKGELEPLMAECQDEESKMAKLIPALTAALGTEVSSFGFPPPPMGMMIGFMAFTQLAAANPSIATGLALLKKSMTGVMSEEEVKAAVAALQAEI